MKGLGASAASASAIALIGIWFSEHRTQVIGITEAGTGFGLLVSVCLCVPICVLCSVSSFFFKSFFFVLIHFYLLSLFFCVSCFVFSSPGNNFFHFKKQKIGPSVGGLLFEAGGFSLPFIVTGSIVILLVPIIVFIVYKMGK